MNKQTESALIELMQVCSLCSNHRLDKDSYTAPEFLDFLDRPLTIEDIPMESNNLEERGNLPEDPSEIPWEDSIKNFTLDLSSFDTKEKFSACILLTDLGYSYSIPTIFLLNKKYMKSSAVILHVTPCDENIETFNVVVRRNNKIEYSEVVEEDFLVASILTWYIPKHTLVLCHSMATSRYKDTLEMMPETTWSVCCSPTNFIESSISPDKCKYICPVYSYPGSMETRAVGTGPISFLGHKLTGFYRGRMNYYFRSIRGSKHSSGRCYDCEVVYKLLISLDVLRDKRNASPITEFEPKFLASILNKETSIQ